VWRLTAAPINGSSDRPPDDEAASADAVRPVLIFSWGNPSRGDDAIGPHLDALLSGQDLPGVDLLTDFQLQIEHVVDLEDRACVVFIDASLSATPPFEFERLQPAEDSSYTTHAMSPAALMAVYCRVNQSTPPPCYLLSIRGYEFGLGQPISPDAQRHVEQALEFILRFIADQTEQPGPSQEA
jgi:hydrogenase maturation protease